MFLGGDAFPAADRSPDVPSCVLGKPGGEAGRSTGPVAFGFPAQLFMLSNRNLSELRIVDIRQRRELAYVQLSTPLPPPSALDRLAHDRLSSAGGTAATSFAIVRFVGCRSPHRIAAVSRIDTPATSASARRPTRSAPVRINVIVRSRRSSSVPWTICSSGSLPKCRCSSQRLASLPMRSIDTTWICHRSVCPTSR